MNIYGKHHLADKKRRWGHTMTATIFFTLDMTLEIVQFINCTLYQRKLNKKIKCDKKIPSTKIKLQTIRVNVIVF